MLKKFIHKFKKEKSEENKKYEEFVNETGENNIKSEDMEEKNLTELDEKEEQKERTQIGKEKNKIHVDINFQDVLDETEKRKANFFVRLKEGLTKTRQGIADKVDQVLKAYKKVDEELFEEIEEILITSDVGVKTTMEIIERLRDLAKQRKIMEAEDLRKLLKEILMELLDLNQSHRLNINESPAIILMVGVNGVGKTTSIGKIAYSLKKQGKRVLLAAGDTFRAAAIDQLEIWGNRVGVEVIKHQEGADPAAVIYDAIQAAKARKIDVLICDTAGRLHNKKNLMNELSKIVKVIEREFGSAAKETLLVLDATTGQNALQQAKIFKEVTDISGIILTKLDGTAKGGVVLAIINELAIPVKLIGVGEGLEDLQSFDPIDFVNALFGEDE